MDVHRVRDVLGRRAEFDRYDEFVDDFGPLLADDNRTISGCLSRFGEDNTISP